MAKLMWIAGIVLAAIGVALGLMVFFSTASIVGWGLTGDTAAILLVGGILALGLGGVINAVETSAHVPASVSYAQQPAASAAIPEFGRRASETVAPAIAAAGVAAATAEDVSPDVKQTIQALEKARQDLSQAFDEKPEPAPSAEPEPAAPEPEAEAVVEVVEAVVEEEIVEPAEAAEDEIVEDGQLYVVEERTIRNRPARILSDGTVEAETEEGWMRFENLEHLDEYLEAMSPSAQG